MYVTYSTRRRKQQQHIVIVSKQVQ